MDLQVPSGPNRFSLYHKLIPGGSNVNSSQRRPGSLRHKASTITAGTESAAPSRSQTPVPRIIESQSSTSNDAQGSSQPSGTSQAPHTSGRRISYANPPVIQPQGGLTPLLETVDHALKDTGLQPISLPSNMTTDDFTRAVAVATVSALRHQQNSSRSPARLRVSAAELDGGGHGGHDAPSWSRTTSASVLLACTALYAIIAGMSSIFTAQNLSDDHLIELLVDVVDVVLEGSGIDEKFLGITLFALVPNTTEFMNAISFAINGNIALRYISCPNYHSNSLTSCIVWRLAPRMHCKSAYYRFLQWLRSLHGMPRTRWVQ